MDTKQTIEHYNERRIFASKHTKVPSLLFIISNLDITVDPR